MQASPVSNISNQMQAARVGATPTEQTQDDAMDTTLGQDEAPLPPATASENEEETDD